MPLMTEEAVFIFDWRITEADFSFEDNRLNSIYLNIYNKSCRTNKQFAADKNAFTTFLDKLRKSLNKFYKTRHDRVSTTLINGARCQSCTWETPDAYVILKWSYDGANRYNFIAEYASIYIYKNKSAYKDTSAAKVASTDPDDLKARVKTDKNGTVICRFRWWIRGNGDIVWSHARNGY